jgi:3-deoxy-7-phosphoheptulonate synthase
MSSSSTTVSPPSVDTDLVALQSRNADYRQESRPAWSLPRSAPASVDVPSPAFLKQTVTPGASALKRLAEQRRQVIDVVAGRDPRLLAIVGPCSIHDHRAALDYAARLACLAERFSDELLICMRVYFEKPRTTVGWKGLINDPHLDDSCDLATGLWLARSVLRGVVDLGLPAASELLEPNTTPYFSDLLCWAAIGARTAESQPHRELASSLGFAVGIKNGTDGRSTVALQGMQSAARAHARLCPDPSGRLVLQKSRGNPYTHLVLRGGDTGPNYHAADVAQASKRLAELGLTPRVLVDCSHGNSQKNHDNQPLVLAAVAEQIKRGSRALLGVMIESHLVAGRQELQGGRAGLCYGQSVTDACVDLATTETMLEELARAQRHASAP